MSERSAGTLADHGPKGWARLDVAFILFIAIFLFLQLFILPFFPVFVEGDHMLPVSNAMRLLDGEVMYRDFFHLSPPGAELYYAFLFSIFGAKFWILNVTIFLLGLAQLYLIFSFSRIILKAPYVYLPALFYFILGFRLFGIDGSFRLFSVIFVLAALLVISVTRSPKKLAIAGALCGLSTFFVQTRGMLGVAAICIFLLWLYFKGAVEWSSLFKNWLTVCCAYALVVIVTQFYMAYRGGLDNYYFANVTFIKDYYRSDSLSNLFAYFTDLPDLRSYVQTYGGFAGIFRYFRVAGPTLFFYACVPLLYVVYFVYRKVKSTSEKEDEILVFLCIVGTLFYLGASAPTAMRLYHMSIPAMIVLVWLFARFVPNELFARVAVSAFVILGLLYCIQRQVAPNVILELPAGNAVFLAPQTAEKYEWLDAETEPGDLLFEAQHPTFYFPLHLKNPTPFYLVRDNNYTPDFQVAQLMKSLENNPPRIIVWHGGWSKEAGERKPGDNLAPLWEYVRSNYILKKEFREFGEYTTNSERDIEFWVRKNS